MGRRRSASTSTRIFQALFAIAWIVFLFYMVSAYLKTPKDQTVAETQSTESVPEEETTNQGLTNQGLTNPGLTTPNATLASSSSAAVASVPSEDNAGPKASEILQNVLNAYSNASAYSDQGKLRVSHVINGSPFDEEYPWRTAWSRDGQLTADIFDAKIRGDGKMLSCFVSEIKTENLKNQQLFLKGNQLVQQLYGDRIAAYYLTGGERIPVNETVVPNTTLLAPTALSLLLGDVESPWLRAGVQPQRLADAPATKDGPLCFVIKCPSRVGDLIAWIDKSNSIIRQVKLPNNLFDPLLAVDPNVKNLKLFARFPNASFALPRVGFEKVEPKPGVWPVREFVAPTDPLPTNLLGEAAPEFALLDQRRAKLTDRQLQGKPVVMLWLGGDDSDVELVKKFSRIENSMTGDVNFSIVVGPNSIQTASNGSWRVIKQLQPEVNRTKIPFLADVDGIESKKFELESLPAVVVLDSKLNIQFAELLAKSSGHNGRTVISQQWDQRLAGAITATQKGIGVADDMRTKYRSYLDKYFNDLDSRSVASYFPGFLLPQQRKVAAVPVKVRQQQTAQKAKSDLNPKMLWQSTQLKSPGNIALIPDASGAAKALLILDGWQTVTLFSVDGKQIGRKQLELPQSAAVNSVRVVTDINGDQVFAMFSTGGEQVYIFDSAMKFVSAFPKTGDARVPVLACEIIPGSASRSGQLLVCFGGSGGGRIYNPFTRESHSAGKTTVRSLALSGRSVIAANDRTGALLSMDDGHVIDDTREYTQVESGSGGQSVFAATAMNANREWSLIGIDRSLKERWSFPVSSVIFDNGIEPLTGVSTVAGKGTWAVADSTNRIYLLSDSGTWLGDMVTDGNVRGLKLMSVGGRTRLAVSTDKKIECWDLNFSPERVGSVSGRIE